MSIPEAVEQHLVAQLGPVSGRAAVTFVGTERIEVLRFLGQDAAGGAVTRYVTVGMSRHPMADPTSTVVDPITGPRAELILSLAQPRDDVFRRLAVLAAVPFVEGLVVASGAALDLAEPLWDGAAYTAVLVAEPGGLVADLPVTAELPGADDVRFFPLLPMTPNETAWKRANGAAALEERWLVAGTDLRDPERRAVSLL